MQQLVPPYVAIVRVPLSNVCPCHLSVRMRLSVLFALHGTNYYPCQERNAQHYYDDDILFQGAIHLAQAVAHHPKLVHVDLFDNSISDEGATALSYVIENSKTIRTLNLWTNLIGDKGALTVY